MLLDYVERIYNPRITTLSVVLKNKSMSLMGPGHQIYACSAYSEVYTYLEVFFLVLDKLQSRVFAENILQRLQSRDMIILVYNSCFYCIRSRFRFTHIGFRFHLALLLLVIKFLYESVDLRLDPGRNLSKVVFCIDHLEYS